MEESRVVDERMMIAVDISLHGISDVDRGMAGLCPRVYARYSDGKNRLKSLLPSDSSKPSNDKLIHLLYSCSVLSHSLRVIP